jgi:aspartate/methionine/tyrosine aminotransferase
VPRIAAEEDLVVSLLEESGVLVHPGYFFDFAAEAYLVLSLLAPEYSFDEGIARVLARVARIETA